MQACQNDLRLSDVDRNFFQTVKDNKRSEVKNFGLAKKVIQKLTTWNQRHTSRQILRSLPEHILKDIGLTRLDALAESKKPFWE